MSNKSSAYAVGFSVVGPLFLGAAEFIARISKARNYSKLFFASRDGFYLKAAYDILRSFDAELPESKYFVSSRKLANSSTIQSIDDVIRVARVDFSNCKLISLLRNRFNLADDVLKDLPREVLSYYGLKSLEDHITQERHRQAVVEIASHFSDIIISKCKSTEQAYTNYLQSIGLDASNCCIVDIGYSGTIQIALSKLLDKKIGGIYVATWERAKQLDQKGLIYDSFIGQQLKPDHTFNKYVQLFELIFSATHPSITDISQTQQYGFEFGFDRHVFFNPALAMLSELRQGALDCVRNAVSSVKNWQVFEGLEPEKYCAPILNFFQNPTHDEALLFMDIVFEDSYGGSSEPLIVRPDRAQPITLSSAISQSIWKEGCKALFEATLEETKGAPLPPRLVEPTSNCEIDSFNGCDITPAYKTRERNVSEHSWVPNQNNKKIGIITFIRSSEDAQHIQALIQSLDSQILSDWTLTIIEQGSTDRLNNSLAAKSHAPKKITLVQEPEQIFKLNKTLSHLDYIVCVAPENKFEPDFLAEIALLIAQKSPEFIYTDHQICNKGETPSHIEFKPDWSPELLLSYPYIGSTYAVSSQIFSNVLNEHGASVLHNDYERLLLLTESSKVIHHIPRPLWSCKKQNLHFPDGQKAVCTAFKRRGVTTEIQPISLTDGREFYRPNFPDNGPSVAIIIPTKNGLDVLRVCVESLDKTTYKNYKVYIIDNESDDPNTLAYLANHHHNILRIKNPDGVFNYSYINNRATEQVTEEYVLFLNNDTEVINPRWLSQMVGWATLPGVGSVGAKLYFKNNKIQHAGLINGLMHSILPAPAFKILDRHDEGYLGHAMISRNYSAVTAACMLTPKKLFLESGAFNEKEFAVAYNDCDYGFRLTQSGYRNVYCADAELYHYEGFTRGIGLGNDKPSEEAECVKRYGDWQDPYYNPNLDANSTEFPISSRTCVLHRPQPFTVLFVTHNLNHEGAPLILSELVCRLSQAGQIRAVIVSPLEGPLRNKYEAAGIQVEVLENMPFFGAKDPISYNQAIYQVRTVLQRFSPEVVFANTVLTWWAIDVATEMGLPSIWGIHESETPFTHFNEHGRFLKNNAQRCLNYPYQVVFVAYSTKKLFEPLASKNNLTVIHNGFEPVRLEAQIHGTTRAQSRSKLGLNDKDIMILTVGTVCDRKNQKELVEALRLIPEHLIENVKVYIVGDRESPYSRELHALVNESSTKLRKRIKIIRETGNVAEYYQSADIFALTSRLESFPVVIQEAMYFGLPIIAHPSYGIREQLVDGVSGLFYSTSDQAELAAKLEQTLSSRELRDKLGENAKVSLGRLPTMQNMTSRYEELLCEAWLSSKPRDY